MNIKAGKSSKSNALPRGAVLSPQKLTQLTRLAESGWKHSVSGDFLPQPEKYIYLFHGQPMAGPADMADAFYARMASQDDIFARTTISIPAVDAEILPDDQNITTSDANALRLRTMLRAIKRGLSIVTSLERDDPDLTGLLEAARNHGYRVITRAHLAHVGADQPAVIYNWDHHVGAMQAVPRLLDNSDVFTLAFARLPVTASETAMYRHIGPNDDENVIHLANAFRELNILPLNDAPAYDVVLQSHMPDVSPAGDFLARHVARIHAQTGKQVDMAVPHGPVLFERPALTGNSLLTNGYYHRLLARLVNDAARARTHRAFESMSARNRRDFAAASRALRTLITAHADIPPAGLSPDEKKVMLFVAPLSQRP